MLKNRQPGLLFYLSLLAVAWLSYDCSQQKDGFINRAYHNTTARYNGYYYSRESIKEGLAVIKKSHQEDFEEILPIYIFPTDEQVPATGAQMDRAIEKSTTVIKRHSMKIKSKERCRWIDENYMAVATGHFYKHNYVEAEKIFEFVSKEFKDINTGFDGIVWLLITYIEENKLDEAGLLLSNAQQNRDWPIKKKGDLYKVAAHYHIARKNYQTAADNLIKAIPYEGKKKSRNRLTYILAQLYNKAGKTNEAVKYFDLVAQNSHDYAMVFNARIFEALSVQNRVSTYKVKDNLFKMLKDDKNIEFQDQIYYALGEISIKDRKSKEAVEYWDKSWKASTTNVKQKSRSFLRLAQYYFDQKLYQSAHVYFDSAVAVLPATYPEADQIKKTSANLDELVDQLNTVAEQDSLLALAALAPEDLEKKLNKITRDLQKKVDDEAAQKELQATIAANQAAKLGANSGPSGSFYFYNQAVKGSGLSDFKKKWGTRKLEDNWRRKNKINSGEGAASPSDELASEQGNNQEDIGSSGIIIKKEELKKNVPFSQQQKIAAHNKIIEALYNAGNIYKEKFKDNENAIESFSNLVQRYDTCKYEVTVYYQLYRLYLQKESNKDANFFSLDTKSSSSYYRELILTRFPESEYARLVENPEFLKDRQAASQTDLLDYTACFQQYKEGNYLVALNKLDSLISQKSSSTLAPKFLFLKSRIQAELHDLDEMKKTLSQIISAFPNSPQATEAKRILDHLKNQVPPATTSPDKPQDQKPESGTEETPVYKLNDNLEHYFILVFPNDGINPDSYKAAIAAFNTRTNPNAKLELSSSFLDNENQLIIIKSFANRMLAMTYFSSFRFDQQNLKQINSNKKVQPFVITVENFISMFGLKKTDAYLKFFTENYMK